MKQELFILSLYSMYFFNTEVVLSIRDTYNTNTRERKLEIFSIVEEITPKRDLEQLMTSVLNLLIDEYNVKCIAIITDNVYLNLFRGEWFHKLSKLTFVMIVVDESEDLLSPNFGTLESIRQVRKDGCKGYIVLIANGIQASSFFKFGDRYRVIDTRAKYVILHDFRLFRPDLHYIWKRIVNVVFIRHHIKNYNYLMIRNSTFELSTVPFPSPIREVLVLRRLYMWNRNKVFKAPFLFTDKSLNLRGQTIQVVAFQHIPAAVKSSQSKSNSRHHKFMGMEVEIMHTFASFMNFIPKVYEPPNAIQEQWGHKQLNGSFSGLLGEMVEGIADVALGNLHYTPYHLQLTDLTIPYISECLTFLTPESLTDNSWKTLLLPFKLYMWVAVLVVLVMSGFIFYGLAQCHKYLNIHSTELSTNRDIVMKGKELSFQPPTKVEGLFLFQELSNSILYTYGMLLVVSLPKLPPGWSIRLLTGWYWLYCVLVVVAYRASMTAILANPATRVSINTMEELAENPIVCGGWGDQTREFFIASLDESGQKIGSKFETVNNADKAVELVTKGKLAYYENIYFLKYLSAKQHKRNNVLDNSATQENNYSNNSNVMNDSSGDRNLHIMKECALNMPISIGLQKNSPLKPRIDKLMRKIIEAGLVEKWLNDVMVPIYATLSTSEDEEIKATMNLKKLYGGFIALGIGYTLSLLCLIGEMIHWRYIVLQDPEFDIYEIDKYYSKKRKMKS